MAHKREIQFVRFDVQQLDEPLDGLFADKAAADTVDRIGWIDELQLHFQVLWLQIQLLVEFPIHLAAPSNDLQVSLVIVQGFQTKNDGFERFHQELCK